MSAAEIANAAAQETMAQDLRHKSFINNSKSGAKPAGGLPYQESGMRRQRRSSSPFNM
jgi:hypothetical protein